MPSRNGKAKDTRSSQGSAETYSRRECLRAGVRGGLGAAAGLALGAGVLSTGMLGRKTRGETVGPFQSQEATDLRQRKESITKGLDWIAKTQSRIGHWTAEGNSYRVAMTALAGVALLCEGSTSTQGKYSAALRKTTDYLVSRARPNGLIGEPEDHQYTYGHGFSMLYLSQILGEEEDEDRRQKLNDVLVKAVEFCGHAQTPAGGWGYISARDGGNFDEGSTTVTQVQGLRSCRNAGIPVPKEVIEKAIKYIFDCQMPDGGICYSSQNRTDSRPAITAAAVACLFNAGQYDGEHVQRLLSFCKQNLYDNVRDPRNTFGHWHYTYYYYAQALYRLGGTQWEEFRDRLYPKILAEQAGDGSWSGNIGTIYCTALNLTMLQLENDYLPIYQR